MRHSTGKSAHRFHFLCLAELILEDSLFSDVLCDDLQHVGGLVRAIKYTATQPDGDDFSILALPLHLGIIKAWTGLKLLHHATQFVAVDEKIAHRIKLENFLDGFVAQHSN